MKLRFLQIGFLLIIMTTLVSAQTSADLDSKYHSIKAYDVRPGILLAVKFNEGGQACEMVLEKRRVSGEAVDYEALLPPAVVEELIKELVPLDSRGAESESSGVTERKFAAGATWYNYENVHVTRIHVFSSPKSKSVKGDVAVIIKWKKSGCNLN